MKLGRLKARVDIPHESFIPHHGSTDFVAGDIIVAYRPDSGLFTRPGITPNFFGPLRLEVTLSGRTKIKVQGDGGSLRDRGGPIFASTTLVHEGPFHAESGRDYKFPFAVNFPDAYGMIPPSFQIRYMDRACTVDAKIEYRLSAQLTTPGLDVKIKTRAIKREPRVQYEIARPTIPLLHANQLQFRHRCRVRMRQKTKAILASHHFPHLVFDVCCTDYQYIFSQHPLCLKIAIDSDKSRDVLSFPHASLEVVRICLVARTSVEPTRNSTSKREFIDRRIVQQIGLRQSLPITVMQGASNALTLDTDAVTTLPSSFRHAPISRQYELKLVMHFNVGDELVRVQRTCPVVLLPGPVASRERSNPVTDPGPPTYLQVQ